MKHTEKNRLGLRSVKTGGTTGLITARTDERFSTVINQLLATGDYRSKSELLYDAVFSLARSKGIRQGVPGPVPTEERDETRLANYTALLRATIG